MIPISTEELWKKDFTGSMERHLRLSCPLSLIKEERTQSCNLCGADSPTSSKGNFASADAARVGGGLYTHVLEALCTLTTDPAPSVAKMGKAVLASAGVQLTPVTQTLGITSA